MKETIPFPEDFRNSLPDEIEVSRSVKYVKESSPYNLSYKIENDEDNEELLYPRRIEFAKSECLLNHFEYTLICNEHEYKLWILYIDESSFIEDVKNNFLLHLAA
jgi:hypothetical protein